MFFVIVALPVAHQHKIRLRVQKEGALAEETVEIPITPFTTCADIVNCLRSTEDTDHVYYLTQVWRGCERITTPEARPYVLARECEQDLGQEVFFRLRRCHFASSLVKSLQKNNSENLERNPSKVTENNRAQTPETSQGFRPASCMAITKNESSSSSHAPRSTANVSGVDSGELTVDELRQISARQQRHIESQRQRLTEKTTRLQQLRRKDAIKKKSGELDSDSTSKLRAKIEEHEIKIKQATSMRMQVNEFKFSNENMAMELDTLKTSFAEKQRELSRYTQRVEELKVALDQLRSNISTKYGPRSPEISELNLLKPSSKLPAPGLIQAVNAELKAKFSGITETDDAKELSRKLEDRRRETTRLDEQLALLRTRLGLKETKPLVPPPPPIRSLSPGRPVKASSVEMPRTAVSLSGEHLKLLDGKVDPHVGDTFPGSLVDRNKGRYAPRSVIADTYMRRLRPGRPQPASVVSATKLDQLRKGASSGQSGESRPVLTTESRQLSPSRPESVDQVKGQPVGTTKPEDSDNNNDSGHGPSITSLPSVGGNESALEDDVFAGSLPVPPPAAFEGDVSSSTNTPNNDFSTDSLSSNSNGDAKPCRPPEASTKPRKSCLKTSCDISLYTATKPDSLQLEEIEKSPMSPPADCITPTSNGMKQSVSFDPLALMLDASMEGELSLVRQTAQQVRDVSAGNDEGSTALHNSVCSGHNEITRFLVQEAAADVNAVDIDGWTPLHCAASCASLPMVRLFVEYGAAVFLCTIGDEETALEKCDEDAEGGQRTAEYLFNVQQQLGVTNGGVVFAVFPYQAKNKDELSFDVNEELTVLKRGDAAEIEWYWARNRKGVTGYIPRNFIALHPRLLPKKRPLSSSKDNPKSPVTEDVDKTKSPGPLDRDEKSDKTAF